MSRKAADGEGRNSPISIKATAGLKAALEKAAARAGRSLAQEVEARLIHSLQDDPAARSDWSDVTRNFTRIVGLSLTQLEQMTGRRWIETKPLCQAAVATVGEVFKAAWPPTADQSDLTPTEQEEADRLAAAGRASASFLTFRNGLEASNKLMRVAGEATPIVENEADQSAEDPDQVQGAPARPRGRRRTLGL